MGNIGLAEAEVIPIVAASIDFDPDTLNLESEGEWITVYIKLPAGHGCDVSDINVRSILLISLAPEQIQAADVTGNGTISATDASWIARKAVGLVDKFPVEQ